MDGPEDLDALIGDVRREAARRRAAPDFPIDDEARLALESDRQGPHFASGHPGVDLSAVLADLDALARAPAGGGRWSRSRQAPSEVPGVARIAGLAGSALRALAARTADLERRADRDRQRLSPPGPATTGPAAPPLDHWIERATQSLPTKGRVLVAGAGADTWLEHLGTPGVDAYGIDPTLGQFADEGPLRSGDPGAHLERIPPGGLGVVVLLRPPGAARPEDLVAAVGRAAPTVAVVSEAPWSWYRRVGPPECDTSADRPVLAETWMALLADAGYRVTAEYGPGGSDYLVRGERDS